MTRNTVSINRIWQQFASIKLSSILLLKMIESDTIPRSGEASSNLATRGFVIRSRLKIVAMLALVVLVPALRAEDGLSKALSRAGFSLEFTNWLRGSTIATADFNHDHHPDAAVLVCLKSTFRIEVYFAAHQRRQISFASSVRAMSVSAEDVNRDGFADLIVRETLTNRPLFVWLNDGHGRFHEAGIAALPRGPNANDPRIGSPGRRTDCVPLPAFGKSRSRHVSPNRLNGDAEEILSYCRVLIEPHETSTQSPANPLRAPPVLQIP